MADKNWTVEEAQNAVPTTVMLALKTLDAAVQDLLKQASGIPVPENQLASYVQAISDTAEAMALAVFAEEKRYEQEKR